MKTLKYLAVLGGLGVWVAAIAYAAPVGNPSPSGAYGAVAVDTTATAVPAVASIMKRRNAFAVYNNGPNTIFCGWNSAVTTATGFPVPSGASLAVDVRYATTPNGVAQPAFHCITTALQVSPADTRYVEVK